MRTVITSFGEDFREWPGDCWGINDWKLAEMKYEPLGKTLPAGGTRALPAGFRLFPGQRAPETKGERAVREIRARASKIGSRS